MSIINSGQLIKPNLKGGGIKNKKELKEIMGFAKDYSFSTNPDYLGIRDSVIIGKGIYKEFFPTPKKYEEFVKNVLLDKNYNIVDKFVLE